MGLSMRRRVALALTAIVAAVSVGCSNTPPPAEPAPEPVPPQKPPVYSGALTLWVAPGLAGLPAGHPQVSWFSERVRAFEAENAGLHVTLVEYPDPHALEAALASQAEKPDVAFARPIPEVMDRLADIDSYLAPDAVSDFPSDAWRGFRHLGAARGVPMLLDARVLAVNKQAAGAGFSVPGSWDYPQFAAALGAWKQAGTYGVGFYHLPGFYDWWTLTATDSSGVTEEGLGQLVQWVRRDGLGDPDIAKRSAEETWAAFAAGRFALMPAPGWALPLLRTDPYNVDLSVAPLPGEARTAGFVYGALVFPHENSLRVEAAAKLALWLSSPGEMVPLARQTGTVPARRSSGNPFEGDPAMTALWEFSPSHRPFPAGPAWKRAEKEVWREYQFALLGSTSPGEAVRNVRSRIASSTATTGR